MNLFSAAGTRFSRHLPHLAGRARLAVILIAIPVVAINALAGPSHGTVQRPPASDAELVAFVADQVRDAGIPGAALAIVRDGRVTTARGIGVADGSGRSVTGETPFVIGSLSKPITALAVMQLVDAGTVELDAPVRKYLPEFALADPIAASRITVRELLDQTSGLPTSAGQRPLSQPVTDLASQVRALADVPVAASPGDAFNYSNANYEVLGLLIERVSGEPYGEYVQAHIFDPLAMTHAHTDRGVAERDGLTRAHRLWFGLADDHAPLNRPDLQPAGFLMASATDLGRFVAAELDGGSLDGVRVASTAAIEETQRGVASMNQLDSSRYGLGWVDTQLGGIRMVGHSGSTTDMAAVEWLAPERGVGIVVLFNAQSTLYELLHKPDLIATAAFEQLVGRAPDGTLSLLYPAVDAIVAMLLGYTASLLVRVARRVRRGESVVPRLLGSRWIGSFVAVWLNAIIPLEILLRLPELLAAPWSTLLRIDIGLVAFVFAILRLATGTVVVAGALGAVLRRSAPVGPVHLPSRLGR